MGQSYSKDDLLKMYYHLKRGRIFTLKMHDAVKRGYIRSSFHTPYGEEAVGVGIVSAMKDTDYITLGHRLQTAMIMRYDTYEFICELYGLRDGIKKGAAYDYHLVDVNPNGPRILSGIGTLGGIVPMNVGFAFAQKLKKTRDVSVICHGDGGCSEGAVYEAWNIGALYKVPAVYVIVNNQWAMTVPLERQSAVPNIAEKAAACGLPMQIVDGNDILALREAMEVAIEKARDNQPNVVEVKTLRWEAHFFGQDNEYRHDKEKIKDGMEKDDCVKRYEDFLMQNGYIDQAYIDKLAAEITADIDSLIQKAEKGEKPKFEDIYRKEFIYASPETGGDI